MYNIDSSNNQKYKQLKKLKQKKYRVRDNQILIEGPLVLEEIQDLGILKEIFIEKGREEEIFRTYPWLLSTKVEITLLARDLFREIQDTQQSQGVIGLGTNPVKKLDKPILRGRYLYTDGIQDPGNMGGLIRSSEAFSFDGVLLGPDSVDPTNPKVIRSTMASLFRQNIFILEDQVLEGLVEGGQKILVLDLDGDYCFDEMRSLEDIILVVGNEANGPREKIRNMAQRVLTIPLSQTINSLNANVAASIAMYELRGGR